MCQVVSAARSAAGQLTPRKTEVWQRSVTTPIGDVLSQVIGKWRSLGRNEKFLFSSGLPLSTEQEWTLINPQLVLIPLVPQLMKQVDPRIVIGIGFALFAASNFFEHLYDQRLRS